MMLVFCLQIVCSFFCVEELIEEDGGWNIEVSLVAVVVAVVVIVVGRGVEATVEVE